MSRKEAFIFQCKHGSGAGSVIRRSIPEMLKFLVKLLNNEDGATAIEYGLIAP